MIKNTALPVISGGCTFDAGRILNRHLQTKHVSHVAKKIFTELTGDKGFVKVYAC